jgi:hypothetical protein
VGQVHRARVNAGSVEIGVCEFAAHGSTYHR